MKSFENFNDIGAKRTLFKAMIEILRSLYIWQSKKYLNSKK